MKQGLRHDVEMQWGAQGQTAEALGHCLDEDLC